MNQFILILLIFLLVFLIGLIGCFAYVIWMPGQSGSDFTRPPTSDEGRIEDNIRAHVGELAAQIGERNLWRYKELEASAAYITRILENLGYEVRKQEYSVLDKTVVNLDVQVTGASKPDEIVVVGAHYDSAIGAPGANDNASGVAALLELARLLAGQNCCKTLRLVFFTNEESPFFQTADMGSLVYARRCHELNEQIVAMLCLETIGYYSSEPGTQNYPFPLNLFYPDTGNFLAFVGNLASRQLVHRAISSFRKHSSFPSEGAAAPQWITGISWSDQWSFWRFNYPAVMLTDTAPFRYPFYHSELDTVEKLDYRSLARIVQGIYSVVIDLACDKAG